MQIQYLPSFKRQYRKLPSNLQVQVDKRIRLFFEDRTDPKLRLHPLIGKFRGYWSININGDLRALLIIRGDQVTIFALLGTHSELYG